MLVQCSARATPKVDWAKLRSELKEDDLRHVPAKEFWTAVETQALLPEDHPSKLLAKGLAELKRAISKKSEGTKKTAKAILQASKDVDSAASSDDISKCNVVLSQYSTPHGVTEYKSQHIDFSIATAIMGKEDSAIHKTLQLKPVCLPELNVRRSMSYESICTKTMSSQ